MPKLVSIVLFAGSAVFLILALVLALTKRVLDVSVLDFYFVVLPATCCWSRPFCSLLAGS
jgi:hypothetical protein